MYMSQGENALYGDYIDVKWLLGFIEGVLTIVIWVVVKIVVPFGSPKY